MKDVSNKWTFLAYVSDMCTVMFFAIVSQTYNIINRRTAYIMFSLLYSLNNVMVKSTEKEGSGLLGVECQVPSRRGNRYLCRKAFTK